MNTTASRRIALGMGALIALGVLAMWLFQAPASPPPAAIAGDPLLVEGREVYLSRCLSCHGPTGRGDGPIAKGLAGPPVGDLTDADWKHGDQPEQVLDIVAQGVRDTAMPSWKSVLGDPAVRAVAAYVYYLAGRPIPAAFRIP